MASYAEHLTDTRDVLASVRQVAALADDLAGTAPFDRGLRDLDRKREAHAAFRKDYGDATVDGISDEADARDLLRDAVNVALSLARSYAGAGGQDPILLRRADEVREEFKPDFGRHHGIGVGGRVAEKFGGSTVSGEVIELHATDNNGATIVDDATGEETEVICEWCAQLPTFRSRETPPAPGPR